MFAKLLFIITIVGATACALLVIRQQRIDTFHEISQAHQRLLDHERTLWQLRSEIAQRCRPQQVRLVMNQLGGSWIPLPARPSTLNSGDGRYTKAVAERTPEPYADSPAPPTPDPTPVPPSKTGAAKKLDHKPANPAGKSKKPPQRKRRE